MDDKTFQVLIECFTVLSVTLIVRSMSAQAMELLLSKKKTHMIASLEATVDQVRSDAQELHKDLEKMRERINRVEMRRA